MKITGKQPSIVPHIHYVSPNGDLSIINRMFNMVFSSHVIEHQLDLVEHFQQVDNILEPGGVYVLAIPDHRYCFDHFLPPSNIGEVLESHLIKSSNHSLRHVVEHRVLTTHNNPVRHWSHDHGSPFTASEGELLRLKGSLAEWRQKNESKTYIDVHAWQFSPESFRTILHGLFALEMISLAPIRVYNTPLNCVEFMAVLKKHTRT